MLRHSPQWRRGVEMVSRHNCYKHYCYLGTSVALQKSLLQALDLHAHELIAKRLQGTHDHNDHALKKLHAELRQKLVDVRSRGSAYFKEWFFQNPISHLRECDGDRCEFWRFRYPHRRDAALQAIVDQALARFPPRSAAPLVVSSFGAGLLYQEFCHVAKLIHAGYRAIRLVLVDTRTRRGSRSTSRATVAAASTASRRPSCTPTCCAPRRPTRRRARRRRRSRTRRRRA